jgi:heat shock protein 90kDa beta
MAPALGRTLGASSVAALSPCPSSRNRLLPQGRGPAAARFSRGVRWEAGRGKGKGRMVGVRCDAAVAEKPADEEEEAAGEKYEYQAEVGKRNLRELRAVWFSFGLRYLAYLLPRFPVVMMLLDDLQVSRLMDLIVHSLYSHKEVFLRELVRSVFFVVCTVKGPSKNGRVPPAFLHSLVV